MSAASTERAPSEPQAKRQKRAYGASCDACRRRRKKCAGRDASGRSQCSYCPSIGLKCSFTEPNAVHSHDRVLSDLSEAKALLAKLVKSNEAERAILLDEWSAKETAPFRSPHDRVNTSTESPKVSFPAVAAQELPRNAGTGSIMLEGDQALGHSVYVSDFAARPKGHFETYTAQWMSKVNEESARDCILTVGETNTLLQSFFCWHNSRFLLPEAETISATVLPNALYMNDFLRYAIYAFTAHLNPYASHIRDILAAKAHLELGQELTRPVSLPTIAGVLLMSTYHPSRARSSQAFTLLGLAHYMILNPQLRADTSGNAQARRLLFRCESRAFQWSNVLAIFMNRPPRLPPPSQFTIQDIASEEDIVSETRRWTPRDDSAEAAAAQYDTGFPLYDISTFFASHQLHEILYQILVHLYSGEVLRRTTSHAFVNETHEALIQWEAHIHPDILLPLDRLIPGQPPNNIVQISLLFRTVWILLYRKFDVPASSSLHLAAAQDIVQENAGNIYRTLLNSGSLRRAGYVAIFAAEVAAITDLGLFQRGSPQAKLILLPRLELYKQMLEYGEMCCPGLPVILATLRRELQQYTSSQDSSSVLSSSVSSHVDPSAPSTTQESMDALLHATSGDTWLGMADLSSANQHTSLPQDLLQFAPPGEWDMPAISGVWQEFWPNALALLQTGQQDSNTDGQYHLS